MIVEASPPAAVVVALAVAAVAVEAVVVAEDLVAVEVASEEVVVEAEAIVGKCAVKQRAKTESITETAKMIEVTKAHRHR